MISRKFVRKRAYLPPTTIPEDACDETSKSSMELSSPEQLPPSSLPVPQLDSVKLIFKSANILTRYEWIIDKHFHGNIEKNVCLEFNCIKNSEPYTGMYDRQFVITKNVVSSEKAFGTSE